MDGTGATSIARQRRAWRAAGPGCLAIACASILPAETRTPAILTAIILLGVPHGALDGEVARGVLRPRVGRAWFAVFAPPYLALSALVLLSWHAMPVVTLALFLAASTWHFGCEDGRSRSTLEVLVRGGLPVAIPVLTQPAATAALLGGIAGAQLPAIPAWLTAGAVIWIALATLWLSRPRRRDGRLGILAGAVPLACCFAILQPLSAFAIYFIGVHAPAHTAALIADPDRGPRVRDTRSALLLAAPLTGLTILLGAALWPLYAGPPAARLLTLTFQGLAALTLPHMLLDGALAQAARAGRAAVRDRSGLLGREARTRGVTAEA